METRTAFSSAVMGVPAYAVGNKIKDIYAIKDYAISNVITCCVLETAVPSTKVGCARRCTLNLKRFDEALLREKLIATHEDDVLTTVSLEYIPCGADELHRSPFGVEGTKRLKRAVTTYRVSQVSQSLNRCYVEIKTELEVAPNPRGDEMEEKHIIAAITYFWQTFVDHLLRSLEAYVLSQAYPVLSTRMDTEFRKTYEAEEEVFCQWTASSKPHFPREEVLSHYEQCLTCWVKVLQEYRHQKMIAEAVKADADGSKRIAAETAKLLAESQAAVEAMRRLQEARDAEPPCLYRNANDTSATSASNPRLEESHNRRRYQKYATTDPINSLNAEHHEVLSMDEQRIVDESNEQARKVEAAMAQAPKHRPPPLHYHPALLQKLFTPAGSLNEPEADIIFRSLDQRERTFVTSEELTRVLVSMDHHGLYEDVDGTMEQLEEYRRAIKRNFKERAFHLSDEDEIQAPSSAAEGGEVAKSGPSSAAPRAINAMERAIARHDAKRLELRENAMRKVAEDTIHRFAFRESEKLFFDEFCLAIMHLLKG